MSGALTTHVLDTASGRPAAGMSIALFAGDVTENHMPLVSLQTNADGRCAAPLLSGEAMVAGRYTLCFYVGDYFKSQGTKGAGAFLDVVPVVFVISEPSQHYHVPLLVTPWSYSTYRGS
ncbi:MAG: hydroxyisourate hydrolase [Planctomycetota bacterium]